MKGPHMTNTCGAKTRAGTPCQKSPLNGKTRCKLHGGASTGSASSKTNAIKHGIYAQTLTASELAQWDGVDLGSVDDELRLCRLRLVRALNAETEGSNKPELDEIRLRSGAGDDGKAKGEKTFRRRDYMGIVDRLLGRIESLEKTRAALMDGNRGGNDSNDELLRQIAESLPD